MKWHWLLPLIVTALLALISLNQGNLEVKDIELTIDLEAKD